MDGHDLLDTMRGMTDFEAAGDDMPGTPPPRLAPDLSGCVTHVTAGNRKMPVLKAMTTSVCERDCYYCPFRSGRGSMRRFTLSPDDMARGFMALHRAGAVEGLFLSSGIVRGGVSTQDRILDVGAVLREKYNYQGYIHLKIMPGAERDQVVRAMQLADRVSINLEAPNPDRLARIAPSKGFDDELLTRLRWVEELRQHSEGRLRSSSTTEFVVGAADEHDVELLSVTSLLYDQLKLARVYYSAFNPIQETPLAHLRPTGLQRQTRLYQASFLLRDYGFELEELPFEGLGDLPMDVDPKRAWADQTLRNAPLEINTAPQQMLIRIPGIGNTYAGRIMAARRAGTLRSLSDLQKLGIRAPQRLAPYVLLDGKRPTQQPRLF